MQNANARHPHHRIPQRTPGLRALTGIAARDDASCGGHATCHMRRQPSPRAQMDHYLAKRTAKWVWEREGGGRSETRGRRVRVPTGDGATATMIPVCPRDRVRWGWGCAVTVRFESPRARPRASRGLGTGQRERLIWRAWERVAGRVRSRSGRACVLRQCAGHRTRGRTYAAPTPTARSRGKGGPPLCLRGLADGLSLVFAAPGGNNDASSECVAGCAT